MAAGAFRRTNAAESAQSVHAASSSNLTISSRAIAAKPGNVRPLGWLDGLLLMEPTMISLKVLSSAAAIALVLPMMVPSASLAQHPNGRANFAVGSGGPPAARFSGGGGAPVARFSGAGAAPVARFSGVSGGPPVARFNGGGGATVTRFSSGGGGAWQGGYGHRYRHGGGGFFPGVVAGAVIGGALASESYAYYGGPGYYAPGDYDDSYYDDGAVVAVAPAPVGDDAVAYCMQTYQSYDPASGTYLGYDGLRHPCP
jgi:hypothetical protein